MLSGSNEKRGFGWRQIIRQNRINTRRPEGHQKRTWWRQRASWRHEGNGWIFETALRVDRQTNKSGLNSWKKVACKFLNCMFLCFKKRFINTYLINSLIIKVNFVLTTVVIIFLLLYWTTVFRCAFTHLVRLQKCLFK